MRLPKFEYLEPRNLKEAAKALGADAKGSVLLAGGTDLLVNMKHRLIQPKQVITLKRIPKLAYITEGKDGVRIGSMTSLHDLATSPVIQKSYPALCQAANDVGAYAHQVMGTLGGNLCQGNRCRYYNQSAFWRSARPYCYKAGGEFCYVIRKPRECHSTYCGDVAPVLIAMDARIQLTGPGGERTLSLHKLYTQNGKKPLSLKKGEIVREILLPPPSGDTIYLKFRLRGSIEFPMVSLALHLAKGGGKIEKAKVIFSGVGSGPVEALETEKMLKGVPIENRLVEKVSGQVTKEVSPMRTSITSPAYKRKIAGVLLKQALEQLS